MSDEHHNDSTSGSPKSGVAKILLGKAAAHKAFSDKALFWFMTGLVFLLPLFFIPGTIIAPEFAKMILLEGCVLLLIIGWGVGRYRDGHIAIPKSSLLLVSLLLLVQFVIAGIFSPTPILSFVGSGYDIGTVNLFVVLFLVMYLASVIFTDRDKLLMLYATLVLSSIIVMIYQLLRHFLGADFLDFGVFTAPTLSPVGKWNDMVALFGGVTLLVLSTLYFFPSNKLIRIPSYLLLLSALFFLLIVDFTILWMIIAVCVGLIIAFAIFDGERTHRLLAHSASSEGREHASAPFSKRLVGHLPWFAVIFLAVALLYGSGLAGRTWGESQKSISTIVGKALGAEPYSEVMLTTRSTYNVLSQTLQESPLFGTGPNRFSSSYLKYKSTDINRTPYWDSAFEFGLGRIPTYFGTTGIIGMILWLAFIVILFAKTRHIFALFSKDRIAAYLSFTLFLLVLYFWSLAFFYLPNITIFALAFVFTGALIAFFVAEGVFGVARVTLSKKDKMSYLITPLVVVLVAGMLASAFLLYRQFSSLVEFRDAQLAANANDIVLAEKHLRSAIAHSERDVYYRALSNLAIAKLQELTTSTLGKDQLAQIANEYIGVARTSAERAIALDPTNFENHFQLGGVYDALGALGIQNTIDLARKSYLDALLLNPKSPRVLFVLGRLELSADDREKAKTYLHQALAERPNFPEAISILVSLEIEDGNTDNAIKILQNGISVEPTNFLLHFALGYLHYNRGVYDEAQRSFEAAVYLNPVYADAKYFLGLSYARRDLDEQAIAQFKDVLSLNPDNKDVKEIIEKLEIGRSIFQKAPPPEPVEETKETGEETSS